MAGGRKPRPTALKLVAGERADRVNDDEPQPGDGVPACPSVNPAVREVWDYTVTQLTKMRVLTMADRDVLLGYCEAVVMQHDAAQLLADEGLIISTQQGIRAHPAVKMQRDAAAQVRQLAGEFGLTPAARTRIRTADQAPAVKEQPAGAQRLLSS